MEVRKIFICYSHKNTELKDEIVNALTKEESFEVLHDTKDIFINQPVHDRISELLDIAEIVIAIATQEWMLSPEAREEFTRAHERKKTLICFADDEANLSSLPQFIRDAKQIHFSRNRKNEQINRLIEEIKKAEVFYDRNRQNIYTRLRLIANQIEKNNTELYRVKLANDLIKNTFEEIRKIIGVDDYLVDIGNENNYLLKSIPIFESASKIYAVSLVGISTFWHDPKYTEMASNYLKAQVKGKEKVIRLFVFSNATQVNNYKNILQANQDMYGFHNNGAVFLCSKKTYAKFIKDTIGLNIVVNIFEEDFGILSYSENGKKDKLIEAKLDNKVFKFRPIDFAKAPENGITLFMDELEKAHTKIEYGQFHESYKILRWDSEFINNSQYFASQIETLFNGDENIETITHLVFFRNCASDRLDKALYDLIFRFDNMKDDLGIRRIDLFRGIKDIHPIDGGFGTKLLLSKDIDYILSLEFSSESALKNYYSHREHSVERERIYTVINPKVKTYYDELHALDKQIADYDKQANEIFLQIEESMSKWFFRLDLRNFEVAKFLVQQKGKPFGVYRN